MRGGDRFTECNPEIYYLCQYGAPGAVRLWDTMHNNIATTKQAGGYDAGNRIYRIWKRENETRKTELIIFFTRRFEPEIVSEIAAKLWHDVVIATGDSELYGTSAWMIMTMTHDMKQCHKWCRINMQNMKPIPVKDFTTAVRKPNLKEILSERCAELYFSSWHIYQLFRHLNVRSRASLSFKLWRNAVSTKVDNMEMQLMSKWRSDSFG